MKFPAVSMYLAAMLLAAATAVSAPAQDAAAPGPASAVASESPEQAQVRVLEAQWADAIVKRDQYAADLVLAPTFVDISASGEVTTKNQQIARLFAKDYGVEQYHETLTSIRVLGDTALAQGTYTLRRHPATGPDQEERGIFTHVYQRSRESWQCINAQRTIIVTRVAPPRTAERDKKGMLPFHVPLVGRKKKPAEPDSSVTEAAPAAAPSDAATPDTAAPAPAAAPADTTQPAAPAPTLETPQ